MKVLLPLTVALLITSSGQVQPRPVGPDNESITFTLEIRDPQDCKPDDCNPEFYDGYGILFTKTARDIGPICFEFSDRITPECVELGNVREWVRSRKR